MPSRRPAVPARRAAVVLLALSSLLTASTVLGATSPADAAPDPRDVTASGGAAASSIEALPTFLGATSCELAKRPGVVALGRSLSKTYPHTGYKVALTCDVPALVEQRQGRGLSWKVSVRKPAQVKQARSMLDWLLRSDADGHTYANARRLGVTRVVWDDREWRADAAAKGWRPSSTCATARSRRDDARCGRSVMQVALGWSGALKQTSYWTGTVAAEDFGPCRAADLSWADHYRRPRPRPCPAYPALRAPAGATKADRELVVWSGVRLGKGSRGAAVRVLQRALEVPVTGTFTTSTETSLRAWQRSHHLSVSGRTNGATWRALLRATLTVPMTTTPTSPLPASSMPVASPNGWRRIYSQDFVAPAPLGSFVTASKDDWYLQAGHPYARALRSYPDGWGTTGNVSLNYASKTVDVVSADHGALGVFRLNAHTDTVDGQRRALAGSFFAVIDPAASGSAQVAQTYGRYSVRFRTTGGYPTTGHGPRYGSAFLLWPADDTWSHGEVDYPEMAWGGPVGGFVHTIGNPSVNAAVVESTTPTEGAWHVATIDWKPSALVFSLDGKVLQTVTHDVPNTPFRWGFQSGGHDGTPPADGVTGQLLVDWITIDAWDGAR